MQTISATSNCNG